MLERSFERGVACSRVRLTTPMDEGAIAGGERRRGRNNTGIVLQHVRRTGGWIVAVTSLEVRDVLSTALRLYLACPYWKKIGVDAEIRQDIDMGPNHVRLIE